MKDDEQKKKRGKYTNGSYYFNNNQIVSLYTFNLDEDFLPLVYYVFYYLEDLHRVDSMTSMLYHQVT